MLKISQLYRMRVYKPKRGNPDDPASLGKKELTQVGRIHMAVFSPNGKRVVGFMVKRPDIAGMIKQEDQFLALDSFVQGELGLVATKGKDSWDDAARKRMGLDWGHCLMWSGMDAKTTDGKELGWVSDVEFSPKTGAVSIIFVGDGGVSEKLVGNVEIPVDMLRGYSKGKMLVDPEAARLALDGGIAAKAGASYGKAKVEGKKVADKAKVEGKKAAEATSVVVEKGAKGLGRQIRKSKGMFGSFMDEYKKASK